MTEDSLVRQAITLAARGLGEDETRIHIGDVKLLIKHALRDLALLVWREPSRRSLLQKEYTLALSSGVGDLSTSDFDDLLRETLEDGQVYHVDKPEEAFDYLPEATMLTASFDTRIGYYALAINQLITRAPNSGKLGELSGNLKLWACFLPTATTIPKELEPEAIQFLAAKIAATHLQAQVHQPPESSVA